MSLTWLGRVCIYFAALSFLLGIAVGVSERWLRRPWRTHIFGILGLAGIAGAVGVMQFALLTHNFSLAYVAENNATFTPILYSITGMWSALD